MADPQHPKQLSARPTGPLPEVLPIFPLTGSLLLPGNWLPLNIFEPRYRAMVEDAQEGDRMIGMVQPVVPRQDNRLDLLEVETRTEPEDPVVYPVGCAGRIERCEPQPDGRYLILLRGASRFRVTEELEAHRGYRRVRADYTAFGGDLEEPETPLDPEPILAALREFARARDLELDLDRLETLPGVTLLNGLAVALPFAPAEKQALLEAEDPGQRRELLLSLMGMGFEGRGDDYEPQPVN